MNCAAPPAVSVWECKHAAAYASTLTPTQPIAGSARKATYVMISVGSHADFEFAPRRLMWSLLQPALRELSRRSRSRSRSPIRRPGPPPPRAFGRRGGRPAAGRPGPKEEASPAGPNETGGKAHPPKTKDHLAGRRRRSLFTVWPAQGGPTPLSPSACTGSRLPVLTRTGGKQILQRPKRGSSCNGRGDAGARCGAGAGDPAHTAEGVRAHGLAGGVGVLPRVEMKTG